MNNYVDTLANQNIELEDINQDLDSKNSKLKNILNNVEQGF